MASVKIDTSLSDSCLGRQHHPVDRRALRLVDGGIAAIEIVNRRSNGDPLVATAS